MGSGDGLVIAIRKRSRIRKYWVNPYLRSRKQTVRSYTAVSCYITFESLKEVLFIVIDYSFRIWFIFRLHLMKTSTWTTKIERYLLPKRDTHIDALAPKQRLSIPLEYVLN